MSMRERAENYTQRHGQSNISGGQTNLGKIPGGQSGTTVSGRAIDTFVNETYAIVDGELTEAYGFAEVPDMSLTVVCAAINGGWTAPVPVSEARLFRNTRDVIKFLLDSHGKQQL